MNSISFTLECQGYETIYGSDARDVVETVLSTRNNDCPIDLFILDVGMYHMAGVELFVTLREVGKAGACNLVKRFSGCGYPRLHPSQQLRRGTSQTD